MIRYHQILKKNIYSFNRVLRKKSSSISIAEEVKDAILSGKPVVALESTIISHGMPYPKNIEVAKQIEAVVRANGAIPATIAIIDGIARVGLSDKEIQHLANPANNVIKASRRDIAYATSHSLTAATTVASTMIFAHLAGIKVFATGGIGGVHRGAEVTMDISADLMELGRTPVAVICGGVKSILDIDKTLEYLETQGVPVIGYNCEEFPAFFTNHSKIKSPIVVTECESIARMIYDAETMKLQHGMVIGVQNPYPADSLMIQQAIDEALLVAKQKNIIGNAVTPHILAAIERITQGRSLESNIALVLNNAKIASLIAIELANIYRLESTSLPRESSASPSSHPVAISGIEKLISVQSNVDKHDNTPVSSSEAASARILCVGGAVVDMVGKISSNLIMKSSNPGSMKMTYGGVMFNICQHLAKSSSSTSSSMKHDIEMISLLGQDNYGQALLHHMMSLGINTSTMQQLSHDIIHQHNTSSHHDTAIKKLSTATYTAIHGPDGDLCVAVADMSIFHHLKHHHIEALATRIRACDMIVVDGNISQEAFMALVTIAHLYYVPVFFEPTSDHKCTLPIHGNVMDKIDVMKPNISELIMMVETCLEKNMIIRNKAIIVNALKRMKNRVDIDGIRVLAAGLLHLMIAGHHHTEQSSLSQNNNKPSYENQLTSVGRLRRIRGKHIMVSMGQDGILWCGSQQMMIKDQDISKRVSIIDDDIACVHMPAIPIKDDHMMMHTSGAGDAFCGGLISSLFEDIRSVGPTARGIQQGLRAAYQHITGSPLKV